MKQQTKEIAERLAGLRDACGYTQEEFAQEMNVSPQLYAQYEETGEDIPISFIFAVANKLNVDFTEILTGISAKIDTYQVVRAGEGRVVDRYEGYFYQDLAYRFSHKIMQPLLVTLDPSDEPAKLVSHTGQEFNYCIKGCVRVTIENKVIELHEGDSVFFNPMQLHGQACGGTEPTTFLTMIAE